MGNVRVKKSKNSKTTKADIWDRVLVIIVVGVVVIGLGMAIAQPLAIGDYISLHTRVSLETENYKVSNAEMEYMVYSLYNNYYSTYSNYGYAEQMGLDPQTPLDQQKYQGSSTVTWRDALVDEAKASMKECLILCEAALAADVKLDDEELDSIDEEIKSLKSYAKENGVSVGQLYGNRAIKVGDIKNVLELQTLANKFSNERGESFSYVDSQYDAYFSENRKEFTYVDYLQYTVEAEYEDDATEAEITEANTKASDAATKIQTAIESGKSFADAVYEYEQSLKAEDTETEENAETQEDSETQETTDEEENPVTNEEKTEQELKEEIRTSALRENQTYSEGELGDWLFADTAPALNSVKVISGTDEYTVYQVVANPYRHDYSTVNVRSLAINAESFDDTAEKTAETLMQEAAAKLAEVIDALTDKTPESFSAIADTIGEEYHVVASDLMEKIDRGDVESQLSVTGFDDWAFGADIKAGDIKTFTTDGLTIVFYYEGAGQEAWKVDVDNALRQADYEAYYKTLEESTTVTENAKSLDKVGR